MSPNPTVRRASRKFSAEMERMFGTAIAFATSMLSSRFRCKHRIEHRKRARGERGLRVGANLLGRNRDGNQIAREYRTCAGHADLLFRDGVKRQAGKCDCLLEFTSRPELSVRAARESAHNSMCQNSLEV